MDHVVQGLAMLAMVGVMVFGFLALIDTARWAASRLAPNQAPAPRGEQPQSHRDT